MVLNKKLLSFVRLGSVGVAIFSALSFSAPASAQLLYCCEVNGHRNCGDSLPRACIGKAYSVRRPGGALVRKVDAPLTPEQLRVREELEKKRAEELLAKKEQARLDSALLATYSSEEEIEKRRQRAEDDFAVSMKAAQGRIDAAEKRKRDAIGDPELYKKRGMPEDLKRKVMDIDFEISTQTELLEAKKKDLEADRRKFAEDRQRYIDIKKRQSNGRH